MAAKWGWKHRFVRLGLFIVRICALWLCSNCQVQCSSTMVLNWHI